VVIHRCDVSSPLCSVLARALWGERWAWIDIVSSFHRFDDREDDNGYPLRWHERTGTTVISVSSGIEDMDISDCQTPKSAAAAHAAVKTTSDAAPVTVAGVERCTRKEEALRALLSELFLCNAIAEYLQ
jgi:hypothetical protein